MLCRAARWMVAIFFEAFLLCQTIFLRLVDIRDAIVTSGPEMSYSELARVYPSCPNSLEMGHGGRSYSALARAVRIDPRWVAAARVTPSWPPELSEWPEMGHGGPSYSELALGYPNCPSWPEMVRGCPSFSELARVYPSWLESGHVRIDNQISSRVVATSVILISDSTSRDHNSVI